MRIMTNVATMANAINALARSIGRLAEAAEELARATRARR